MNQELKLDLLNEDEIIYLIIFVIYNWTLDLLMKNIFIKQYHKQYWSKIENKV